MGFHVIEGNYGRRVKLDDVNFAWIGSWPGPVYEGRRGEGTPIYIDDRANDDQFDALSNMPLVGLAVGLLKFTQAPFMTCKSRAAPRLHIPASMAASRKRLGKGHRQ